MYELHVTVEATFHENSERNFRAICRLLEVKPVIIILNLKDPNVGSPVDYITASHYSSLVQARTALPFIIKGLVAAEFRVVRWKIETDELIPEEVSSRIYSEAHIKAFTTGGNSRVGKMPGVFISRNMDDPGDTVIYTYRVLNISVEFFNGMVDYVEKVLRLNNNVLEVRKEHCLLDSNLEHDYHWTGKVVSA